MDFKSQLRSQRDALIAEGEALCQRAQGFNRDLSAGEKVRYDEITAKVDAYNERLRSLEEEESRNAEMAAAMAALGAGHSRAQEDPVVDMFRSMLIEGNPKPITLRDNNPRSLYQPGVERRDLATSAPSSFTPVSMMRRIFEHAVDASAVLRAGATVLTTESGETVRLPRSTALSTASIISEGSAIAESDPTLSTVALGAHKYAILVQVTRELLEDTAVDLQEYLARETGQAIGLALGNHLINGTGTGQPRGVLADTTLGIAGPTGTATSLGAQGTAGQGTDLLNELYGSVAEPYAMSKAAAFLLRNASLTKVKNLKTTAGELVGNTYIAQSPAPFYADAYVPAMAANAKSILFGDWSRYVVRMVNGLRFERSDDFAFDSDKATFRAILRADGALINTDAIKHFTNSAT